MAAGSVIAAPIFLLPGAVMSWPQTPVSVQAWFYVVAPGVVSTGLVPVFFLDGKHISASKPDNRRTNPM